MGSRTAARGRKLTREKKRCLLILQLEASMQAIHNSSSSVSHIKIKVIVINKSSARISVEDWIEFNLCILFDQISAVLLHHHHLQDDVYLRSHFS
jgi:hypothetical protein